MLFRYLITEALFDYLASEEIRRLHDLAPCEFPLGSSWALPWEAPWVVSPGISPDSLSPRTIVVAIMLSVNHCRHVSPGQLTTSRPQVDRTMQIFNRSL